MLVRYRVVVDEVGGWRWVRCGLEIDEAGSLGG